MCPGTIDTPQTERYLANASDPAARRELESASPLGRRGTPNKVADYVLFLASEEASCVTGSALVVVSGVTLSP
jgi:NAD(P)-dependent dehydrogenase (short-subunit alcohol dehydrogenase family)